MKSFGIIEGKRIFVTLFFLLLICNFCNAQAIWKFAAKKIDKNTHEIHLTVTIAENWHIYSQDSPSGGPVPTKITFKKNPMIVLKGKVEEIGKLQRNFNHVFDLYIASYSNSVDFKQVVIVRKGGSAKLEGSIQYMLCTNTECMRPIDLPFSINLE